jgi:hypothetical protein
VTVALVAASRLTRACARPVGSPFGVPTRTRVGPAPLARFPHRVTAEPEHRPPAGRSLSVILDMSHRQSTSTHTGDIRLGTAFTIDKLRIT